MPRVRLIHWNAGEAESAIAALRSAGYQIDYDEKIDHRLLGELKLSPPAAIVIDLSRLPSHGREVATAVRGAKATRQIPIVFVGGAPEKVDTVRRQLPDAVYTPNSRLRSALRWAIAHPPQAPVIPAQMMERSSARATAQKLGITEGSSVSLIDPPRDYPKVIGEVPSGVRFEEQGAGAGAVTLWFVHDPDAYRSALPRLRELAGRTKLWILWSKQTARVRSPVTQALIREEALALGLVDYKICSVNETWSAMLFARKKGSH